MAHVGGTAHRIRMQTPALDSTPPDDNFGAASPTTGATDTGRNASHSRTLHRHTHGRLLTPTPLPRKPAPGEPTHAQPTHHDGKASPPRPEQNHRIHPPATARSTSPHRVPTRGSCGEHRASRSQPSRQHAVARPAPQIPAGVSGNTRPPSRAACRSHRNTTNRARSA